MNYLKYIVDEIHTVIAATVDNENLPVTCAIDIMDYDDNSLYFLTARGKSFYQRLIDREYIAFTAMKGESTLTSVAVSVKGKVKEIGSGKISELFEKNKYMYEIYPTEESRVALTVFQIVDGSGEWFDLSKKPIERTSFHFGASKENQTGYYINDNCIACESCLSVCPQSCIDIKEIAVIHQSNCLHCGNCYHICPVNAVEKR